MHRVDGNLYVNFRSADDIICGSRCKHLRGQEVLLGESTEDGDIKAHWDSIFID